MTAIMAPYEGDTPRYRSGEWRKRLSPASRVAAATGRLAGHHRGAARTNREMSWTGTSRLLVRFS